MNVIVNGEPRAIPEGSTVTSLLRQLDLAEERVAVERNSAIVPRSEHARTTLSEGDRLELVRFVGGG